MYTDFGGDDIGLIPPPPHASVHGYHPESFPFQHPSQSEPQEMENEMYYPHPYPYAPPYERQRRQPYRERPPTREHKRRKRNVPKQKSSSKEKKPTKENGGHESGRRATKENGGYATRKRRNSELEDENENLRNENNRLKAIIKDQQIAFTKGQQSWKLYEDNLDGPLPLGNTTKHSKRHPESPRGMNHKDTLTADGPKNVRWQSTPFTDMPISKPPTPNLCNYLFPEFDVKIKIILLETNDYCCTTPYRNAPEDFKLDTSIHDSEMHFIKSWKPLSECHLRVILFDEQLREDVLLGTHSISLRDLAEHNVTYSRNDPDNTWRYGRVQLTLDDEPAAIVYLKLSKDENQNVHCKVQACKRVKREVHAVNNLQCSSKGPMVIFSAVISYFLLYALVIHTVERSDSDTGGVCETFEDFGSTLWFVAVTFSSVGYNLSPCTETGKFANALFMLGNLILALFLGSIAVYLFIIDHKIVRTALAHIQGQVKLRVMDHCESGDQVLTRDVYGELRTAEIKKVYKKFDDKTQEWDITYTLNWVHTMRSYDFERKHDKIRKCDPLTQAKLVRQTTNILLKKCFLALCFICFGTIFFKETEEGEYDDLTFTQTFHFTLATLQTVGYGDFTPKSTWGRAIGSFFVLIGCILVGYIASSCIQYIIKSDGLRYREQFLARSVLTPQQRLNFDRHGTGLLSKYEYLRQAIEMMNMVGEEEIDLIMSKFNDIDLSKTGVISVNDLRLE